MTVSSPWAQGNGRLTRLLPRNLSDTSAVNLKIINIKYQTSFFTRALQNLRTSLGNQVIHIWIIASIVHSTPFCRLWNSFKHGLTFFFYIYTNILDITLNVFGEKRELEFWIYHIQNDIWIYRYSIKWEKWGHIS